MSWIICEVVALSRVRFRPPQLTLEIGGNPKNLPPVSRSAQQVQSRFPGNALRLTDRFTLGSGRDFWECRIRRTWCAPRSSLEGDVRSSGPLFEGRWLLPEPAVSLEPMAVC